MNLSQYVAHMDNIRVVEHSQTFSVSLVDLECHCWPSPFRVNISEETIVLNPVSIKLAINAIHKHRLYPCTEPTNNAIDEFAAKVLATKPVKVTTKYVFQQDNFQQDDGPVGPLVYDATYGEAIVDILPDKGKFLKSNSRNDSGKPTKPNFWCFLPESLFRSTSLWIKNHLALPQERRFIPSDCRKSVLTIDVLIVHLNDVHRVSRSVIADVLDVLHDEGYVDLTLVHPDQDRS